MGTHASGVLHARGMRTESFSLEAGYVAQARVSFRGGLLPAISSY